MSYSFCSCAQLESLFSEISFLDEESVRQTEHVRVSVWCPSLFNTMSFRCDRRKRWSGESRRVSIC